MERTTVSTSGSSGTALGQFDEDAAVADQQRIALQLNIGIEIVDAGETIEGPRMPRANDVLPVKIAFTQRTTSVRADTIEAA